MCVRTAKAGSLTGWMCAYSPQMISACMCYAIGGYTSTVMVLIIYMWFFIIQINIANVSDRIKIKKTGAGNFRFCAYFRIFRSVPRSPFSFWLASYCATGNRVPLSIYVKLRAPCSQTAAILPISNQVRTIPCPGTSPTHIIRCGTDPTNVTVGLESGKFVQNVQFWRPKNVKNIKTSKKSKTSKHCERKYENKHKSDLNSQS